ncbi:hypothetical protein GHT06_022596 [Daphnia sinensis]|uniref:Uncharacterized protein n=1 Tax=Daphnia sinensis TaxID=1820382 RepID=A0AAD5KH88_9CRUS|nr:hypothetical protein GHT06_022596 [Daphnia sinensis]
MENGLGPSTNNTRRTSSTSLPVSDQRRTILSEAGLNRIVARTKHTTERFNGDASLTFSSAAFLSSTPLRDRLSTPPRTAAPINGNLGQLPQEIINFMAESNAKQERLMSIVTTLATQKTTQAVPQDEADDMIDSLELPFNDFLKPMQEAITNFLKDAKDRKGGRQMRNRNKENVAENSSSSSSSSSSEDDD